MPKDEYQTFQDHVFDVIRDMEDAELNEARQRERHMKYWARFIGRIHGLTEDEVFALRTDGMTARQWREAVAAARKRDWPPVGYYPRRRRRHIVY
jgi:hypothetical protein